MYDNKIQSGWAFCAIVCIKYISPTLRYKVDLHPVNNDTVQASKLSMLSSEKSNFFPLKIAVKSTGTEQGSGKLLNK